VALGVVGPDCGIGGRDSNKDAPKDDIGLNGLRLLKPVIWGFSWLLGAELDEVIVAPVCCDDSDEMEENKESDAVVVDDVFWGLSVPKLLGPNLLSSNFRPNAKDEATLEIDDSPRAPKRPVCCG
jgi:hypothetical protein